MWPLWANYLIVATGFESCPNCTKSPNLVTLFMSTKKFNLLRSGTNEHSPGLLLSLSFFLSLIERAIVLKLVVVPSNALSTKVPR